MGLFSKKSKSKPEQGSKVWNSSSEDERMPGVAGYNGYGLKKNAMPENRFTYRPPGAKK